jgi:hypothetical protein
MNALAFLCGMAVGLMLTIVMVAWVIGVDWTS